MGWASSAERVGFEPTDTCVSTVFKTVSFGRSDTSPRPTATTWVTAGRAQSAIPPACGANARGVPSYAIEQPQLARHCWPGSNHCTPSPELKAFAGADCGSMAMAEVPSVCHGYSCVVNTVT